MYDRHACLLFLRLQSTHSHSIPILPAPSVVGNHFFDVPLMFQLLMSPESTSHAGGRADSGPPPSPFPSPCPPPHPPWRVITQPHISIPRINNDPGWAGSRMLGVVVGRRLACLAHARYLRSSPLRRKGVSPSPHEPRNA